jgi:hypothetical protein
MIKNESFLVNDLGAGLKKISFQEKNRPSSPVDKSWHHISKPKPQSGV